MRTASVVRKTGETDISINLNIDGTGKLKGKTGIGFFDHMINLMVFHGKFDLDISVTGDLETGSHHTVEDFGLALGTVFFQALGDKVGIERYGISYMPMDETLVRSVVDLSGRPYLKFDEEFKRTEINGFALEDIKEFLKSFSNEIKANIHMEIIYGENDHHRAEAVFKGLGRSLRMAATMTSNSLLSTKGVL